MRFVVRYIYYLFILGKTANYITNYFTDNRIATPSGKVKWHNSVVNNILTNEKYAGNALLQKQFVCDFLTKKRKRNNRELPRYLVENDHEPIIQKDVWNYVQSEMQSRDLHYSCSNTFSDKHYYAYCFVQESNPTVQKLCFLPHDV